MRTQPHLSLPGTLQACFANQRVLVTGSTGFKGSWLSEWLLSHGAEVYGFALPPEGGETSLFHKLGLEGRLRQTYGDLRDPSAVDRVVAESKPHFVFHLGAQPLVRLSYSIPVETYAVNVMGTIHVMDALRRAARPCVAVLVTTDKCYENREWLHSYREEDPMGGYDPYSSSKGMAELAIAAYRKSYFSKDSIVKLASARAGNVIGGGDWAADRIVPDCMRSLGAGRAIPVRNKVATRPWQHVLEPLSGYLWLAACLANPKLARLPGRLTEGFNFGPELESNRPVGSLVEEILKHWQGAWEDQSDPHAPHEATLLNLAIDKARHVLAWHPVWSFSETIRQTVSWYRNAHEQGDAFKTQAYTLSQIRTFTEAARSSALPWAR